MESVVVKLGYKRDLRRWTVPRGELNIATLERKIRDLFFPTAPTTPFVTKYIDEDEDLVTLETQDDLEECLNQTDSLKLRLFISDPQEGERVLSERMTSRRMRCAIKF